MRKFLTIFRLSWFVVIHHAAIYRKNLMSNILPTLTDPMFFIVSFGIGLGAYVSDVHSMNYLEYMAPGLAISTALFTAFFETSYNVYIRVNFLGIYRAMITTPIGPREIILGEYMWVAIKGGIMSTAVVLVLLAFGAVDYHFAWMIPLIGSAVALACGGLGLIATSMVKDINQFQTVYALLISPMFFFSGIFFPLEPLPEWVRFAATLSPLYHGVRLGQETLWNGEILSAYLWHFPIMLVMATVLCWVAYKRMYPKLYS